MLDNDERYQRLLRRQNEIEAKVKELWWGLGLIIVLIIAIAIRAGIEVF